MKLTRLTALVLVILGLVGMLTGCGAKSAPQRNEMEMPMEENAAADAVMPGELALPDSRKWIVTVNMEAETEDLDVLLASVMEQVKALEGYVENQEIYNGSSYSSTRWAGIRRARLALR